MPNPLPGDVHVNIPLTNISIAYIQQETRFIAGQVFPIVPSAKQSNRYFVYEKADWFRLVAKKRAPATESAGGGFNIDNTPNFYCDKYAIHKDVDDDTRANSDQAINCDRDATLYVTQQLLLLRERIFVENYFTTGVWTDVTGGVDFTKWSSTNSDPVLDIDNYRNAVASLTGYEPNILVLSPTVFATVKNNASIKERVKYTQRAVITQEILAGLFELDKVLVPKGVINSAAEGAAEDTDFIFPEGALLAYANPDPSPLMPSAGYTFSWTGYLGAGREGNRIKSFRMEELGADRIEGELACDLKVVASDLAVFFSDPI